MLKKITILLLFVFVSSTSLAQKVEFSSFIPDFPIMSGLSEVKDSAIAFDKAQGRIFQITLKGQGVSKDGVLSFYTEILPQLGWNKIGTSLWKRSGEVLNIGIVGYSNGFLWVRVEVSPAKK